MSNALSTLPASVQSMAAAIVAEAQQVHSGGLFLKFSKGDWTYGADQTDVEEGSEWAVNPASMRSGYQAWGKEGTPQAGQLLGERLLPLGQPVDVNALPDHGVKWQAAVSVSMKCLSGEDKDLQVEWGSCSAGGVKAFREGLLAPIGAKLSAGDAVCVPVVTLETDSYMHKDKAIGKVKFPVFNIVRWVGMDGEGAEEPEAVEEQAEEPAAAPARRRRVK